MREPRRAAGRQEGRVQALGRARAFDNELHQEELSPLAMPHEIEYTDKLPRTRSGKILRRYLRAIEWGEDVGDLSTLEDDWTVSPSH